MHFVWFIQTFKAFLEFFCELKFSGKFSIFCFSRKTLKMDNAKNLYRINLTRKVARMEREWAGAKQRKLISSQHPL